MTAGTMLTANVHTSGQTIFARTDSEGSYYRPLITVPSQSITTWKKVSYRATENEYICFSADNNSTLYIVKDPALDYDFNYLN